MLTRVTPDTTSLARIGDAHAVLATAETVPDLDQLRRKLTAFQHLLKQRGDSLDAQNDAAELRLRAERKLGALIKQTVVPRGNHGRVVGAAKSLPPDVTKKQSLYWRRESEVPEDMFERWAAETRAAGDEITSAGLLQIWAQLHRPSSEIPIGEAVFSSDQIVDRAFAHFREAGFPYRRVPVHVAMQALNRLATMDAATLLSTPVGYDVADTYHPHRFRATIDGKGHSPLTAFESEAHLRKALRVELEVRGAIPAGYFSGLGITSAGPACSNFRPGVACYYYRRYCPRGGVALDTSTGYGGRLVGFLGSGLGGRYVGIDPNIETHAGNQRLAADLGFADSVDLHCLPAEDLNADVVRDRCDFALTSPPYFAKERYSDEPTQSWRRYATGDGWRDGFLRPMLRLQFAALKPGSFNVVNVDDVRVGNRLYPVSEWTKTLALDIGFELVGVDRLRIPGFWGKVVGVETDEPIFIFRKPR